MATPRCVASEVAMLSVEDFFQGPQKQDVFVAAPMDGFTAALKEVFDRKHRNVELGN